jgi:polysaccharide deacetylase family protein (PEP-CTERM system associated)
MSRLQTASSRPSAPSASDTRSRTTTILALANNYRAAAETPPAIRRCHALTIDVEDYFQVTAFEHCVERDDWPSFSSRVERNTQALLEMFARHDVRGTFFVLGWIAQRYPQLVREIAAAGHEIASHGYWHRRIYLQSPDEFRADVRRAREVLEDAIGNSVTMYRAPTFSITHRSLWALPILVEEGFTLDASIFPIRHDRYGMPNAQSALHRLETPSGPLWEFPPTVARIAGWRLPVGGGGYFRLLPWGATRSLWRRCMKANTEPLMFYLHPWEIDPDQPRVAGVGRLATARHRLNLRSTARKLQALLTEFPFGTISDALAASPRWQQAAAAST